MRLRAISAHCGRRVCAIGPATRDAIERLHIKVDLMGEEYVAESLAEAFRAFDLAGKRILLPRAAVARDVLPAELTRRGARVDVVEAYRTVVPESAARQAAEVFGAARKPDWITFTSSSTVQNFVSVAGAQALAGVKVASIGPVTSATAQRLGIRVDAQAEMYDTAGLVKALLLFYVVTARLNAFPNSLTNTRSSNVNAFAIRDAIQQQHALPVERPRIDALELGQVSRQLLEALAKLTPRARRDCSAGNGRGRRQNESRPAGTGAARLA